MGWANCGTDDLGRPIGYAFPATCDQPGCEAAIDRGLSYACGSMHGGGTAGCGGYFCAGHLRSVVVTGRDDRGRADYEQVCPDCRAAWLAEHPEGD